MKSFFISSTFRDMQAERDIIHRIVFPSLRKKLKKYGEIAEDVDLRWGVDTLNLSEEESGHMVIKVCIDAIDRCVPYLIVLLGERYGWIPEAHVYEKINDKRLNKFPEDISITEMEIQYGALMQNVGIDHCVFCFRGDSLISKIPKEFRKDYEAESVQHKEKLDCLKAKIRNKEGAHILNYEAKWNVQEQKVCGLEFFAEELERKLMELLQKEGLSEEKLSIEENITRNAENTMQQYLSTYVNRVEAEEYLPFLYAAKKNIWFSAPSGYGKTAFISFAANQHRQKDLISRIYYGGEPRCQNVDIFLDWLVYELEKICGKKLKEDNHTRRLNIKKIQSLAKQLPDSVMIFIDAIDQMSEDIKWILLQLINTTPKLKFFVTSTQTLWDFEENIEIKELKEAFVTRKLNKLTDTELEMIIFKIAGRRGKSLDARVTKKIREKENMHLPVNLSLMLQRLFMMDGTEFANAEKIAPGMEGISKYMQRVIDSSGEMSEELVEQVVNKAIDTMKSEGGKSIIRLLGLVAAAPEGISLRMLSELCPDVTPLQIQQLLCFLYDMVEENEEGRWVYKHPLYLECIRKIIGEEIILTYEEAIYKKWKDNQEFHWSEFLSLGKKLKKLDVADAIIEALQNGEINEERLWNDDYYIKLSKIVKNENYLCSILRGISQGVINWSDDVISLLNETEGQLTDKETLFYLYDVKCNMYDYEIVFEDDKTKDYADEQYGIYEKIENVSKELLLQAVERCMSGCRSHDQDKRKLWFERLSDTVNVFSKCYRDSNEYLLLSILQVCYWRFVRYKESRSEEDLKELEKIFEAQYTICKVQDNLNLYEQEQPGYNEYAMKQLAVFARILAGVFLKDKNYPKAYPYAKIAYEEEKKAYQLRRTFKTADLHVWTATNYMLCLKEESDTRKRVFDEGIHALDWMESQYFCTRVGESQHYLYFKNALGKQKAEMCEKALEISRRLCREYPGRNYENWIFYDIQDYKNALKAQEEHQNFDKITVALFEIEILGAALYEQSKERYYLDSLHACCLDLVQAYLGQDMFQEAELYLQKAEGYLKNDCIQKAKVRWHREVITSVSGITLYYRNGETEKLKTYMKRAELLLGNEEECNKSGSRKNLAILWRGRIQYMKSRMCWEESKNLVQVRSMIEEYFDKYEKILDENELRPARLFLGEIEAAAGNTKQAIALFKKVRMRNDKDMGWDKEVILSEYEIWQYIMGARASFHIYDLPNINNVWFLNDGMSAFTIILICYTRNMNAAYRPVVGKLLAEYFMKYKHIENTSMRKDVARVLLIWMKDTAEQRILTKEEKDLLGECLIYCRNDFDPREYSEEKEKSCNWLVQEKQKDRANKFLVKKALWYCVNEMHEEALKICESMFDEIDTDIQNEKELLINICKIRIGKDESDAEILERYIANPKIEFWMHFESLIALGHMNPLKEEIYFRKAAKMLEKKVLETRKATQILWEKDWMLRSKCLQFSKARAEETLYIEDLKAVRMAWANCADNGKESTVRLLELDAQIARAYEGTDEKLEWTYWESVGNIMNAFLIKKDILSISELEKIVVFYHKLFVKANDAQQLRYYTISMLSEVAYETMLRLYDLTEDTKWLDETLKVMENYRIQINSPKLNDRRKDFKNEKIVESYLYDMDVYWLYLQHCAEEKVIECIVHAAKSWIKHIPDDYKKMEIAAIGVLRKFDEFLEGRSLDIKALYRALQMKQEGDSNEIFWFIKGIYDKEGTTLSLEQLREMYQKENQ